MKIVVAQHNVKKFGSFAEYKEYYEKRIAGIKATGAELFILPEYAGLELVGFSEGELQAQIEAMQKLVPDYIKFWQALADKHNIILQPGTILEGTGSYHNRAYFFAPNKQPDFQDKLQLTQYEKGLGFVKKGSSLKVFEGIFGINICYDVEFPAYAHELAHKGVKILLVPSCTETKHGLTRVTATARARAIENQFYVVNSATVGYSEACDICDVSAGLGAVYTPADAGFPDSGILAAGTLDKEQDIYAELNLSRIDSIRRHGATHNFADSKTV